MLAQIILRTPHWVWGLLAALLLLGFKQARPNRMGLRRATVVPLVMVGLSVFGTVSVFGALPGVLLAWLMAAAGLAAFVLTGPQPRSAHYDAVTRTLHLPGSWVPLILMMGLFATKYAVGVSTSLQPALAHDAHFALAVAGLYGAFSGIFIARAARLLRLAQRDRSEISTMGTPLGA